MDELAMGALLAVWESEGKLTGNAKKFIIAFFLVLIPTIILWVKVTGGALAVVQVLKFNLLSLSCFCLVGFVISLKPSAFVNRILASRFFSFSGKISYGLYVYHPLCFTLIATYFPADMSIPLAFLVSFGIVYLVAYISYFFFEARFIEMKKYFQYNRPLTKTVADN